MCLLLVSCLLSFMHHQCLLINYHQSLINVDTSMLNTMYVYYTLCTIHMYVYTLSCMLSTIYLVLLPYITSVIQIMDFIFLDIVLLCRILLRVY